MMEDPDLIINILWEFKEILGHIGIRHSTVHGWRFEPAFSRCAAAGWPQTSGIHIYAYRFI